MKEELTWVLKWYQDKPVERRVFIPFYVKAHAGIQNTVDMLNVWKVDDDMVSDWIPISHSEFEKEFTEVKPTSEERRDQIKYAFETENYFEGVE